MGIKVTKNTMSFSLDKISRDLGTIPRDAHKVWVDNTAKRSGNARSKTTLNGNTIKAAYPYAERLDKGWSKQTPQGMSKPTERFIQQELRKKIRK